MRVTAKYHGIKLEFQEHRHTVLDLLGQIRTKLRVWKRPYISPEAVRVLLQEWHVSSSVCSFGIFETYLNTWEWFEGKCVQCWQCVTSSVLGSDAAGHFGACAGLWPQYVLLL